MTRTPIPLPHALPLLFALLLVALPGASSAVAMEARDAVAFLEFLKSPGLSEVDAVAKELQETLLSIENADKRKDKTIRHTWRPHLAKMEAFVPRLGESVAFLASAGNADPEVAGFLGELRGAIGHLHEGMKKVIAATKKEKVADFKKAFTVIGKGFTGYRACVAAAAVHGKAAGESIRAAEAEAKATVANDPAQEDPAHATGLADPAKSGAWRPETPLPAAPADFVERLLADAAGGDAEAMFRLGGILRGGGFGLDGDPELSFFWLRQAADAGHLRALVALGDAYAEGVGTKPDPVAAFDCFRRAADLWSAPALRRMGDCLRAGEGCAKNPELSLTFYRMAAERGDPLAPGEIARAYEEGLGVPRDPALAFRWRASAAADGK